jgi:hypothetical protein
MMISNDNFWEILKVFFVPDFGKLRKSAPQLERSSFLRNEVEQKKREWKVDKGAQILTKKTIFVKI